MTIKVKYIKDACCVLVHCTTHKGHDMTTCPYLARNIGIVCSHSVYGGMIF